MKIKLVNQTHWRSDHLRAFIRQAARDERPDLCKRGAATLHVTVKYNRQVDRGWCSGVAGICCNWIRIMLPSKVVNKVDLAYVIAHELAHTRGKHHRDMTGNALYDRMPGTAAIYAWGETLPLEQMPVPVKVAACKTLSGKLTHALRMLKIADTRYKRAVTLQKKWQVKVRYYQRRAGA